MTFRITIIAGLISMLIAACQTACSQKTSGEWVADFQVAKEVARQTGLPILLNFSCGPSIAMDEEVFSKPAWKKYAVNHLVMVHVNISYEVMEDMRKADPTKDAIRIQYDIKGYPSFVLLDDDGETVLGLLGGRRLRTLGEPSPNNFRPLLRPYLHYWSFEVERASSLMNENDRERYQELAITRDELMHEIQNIFSEVAQAKRMRWYAMAEIKELEAELKNLHSEEGESEQDSSERVIRRKELSSRIEQLKEEKEQARALEIEKDMPLWSKSIVRNFVKAEEEMRYIRVAQLSKAKQAEYKELVEQVERAERRQGNLEDKMEYYRLDHQKLVY